MPRTARHLWDVLEDLLAANRQPFSGVDISAGREDELREAMARDLPPRAPADTVKQIEAQQIAMNTLNQPSPYGRR